MSDFWKEYEQEEQEAAGGGIVGKASIDLVWKTFPSGIDQAETLFPAPPCHKNSPPDVKAADKKARLAAKALGDKHGAERDPSKGFSIRVYRDEAVSRGRLVTWQGDRFFFEASWTEAGKQVRQSIRDAGIANLPWEGWTRIGFFDNPYHVGQGEAGKTKTDQDGNPAYPTVAYVVEAFADEDAARAAIGTVESTSVGGVDVVAPEGWDAESWKSVWPELYQAKEEGKNVAQIAKDYGVTAVDVSKALAAHLPY